MKIHRLLPAAVCAAFSLLTVHAAAGGPAIEISHHLPCNLFDPGEPVQFTATLHGLPRGDGKATVTLTDFFQAVKTFEFPLKADGASPVQLPLDLGKLPPGYYEMNVTAGAEPATIRSEMASFGVVRLVKRTAAEARRKGSRFGLKAFALGAPGVWWHRPLVWKLAEVVDGCAALGLQWTRYQFNQPSSEEPGVIGTNELIEKHPMNVVLKIEGFPESCYDAARYGPLAEWPAKHKTKSWARCTVPMKGPYQEWLKAEVAKIPAGQDVFEIGNEVWNYMSAEEFAEWTHLVVPAVLAVRPTAKIGADPGNGDKFTRRFLHAKGMDGLGLLFDHPYSFTPPPEHRTRPALRNLRDLLRRHTGRDFDLYITEYGWQVSPNDPKHPGVSEKVQAQRTARQSLLLYAEDAKTLIPHWMGDREQDPTNWDQWFGFFRLSEQPRPVAVAHAVCARMIDGSRFAGDLFLGKGVGALLFEEAGRYTLALSTADEVRDVTVDVGVPAVSVVDLVGGEKQVAANGGKVAVHLDGGVVYLVGVSADLAKRAIPPGQDLNPDVWTRHQETVAARRMPFAPKIDGDLGDWRSAAPLKLVAPPGTAADCQAEATLGWDDQFLYAAIRVSGQSGVDDDTFEWSLCTRPARQPDLKNARLYDYQFALPGPGAGPAAKLKASNDDFDQTLECPPDGDPSGIRWATRSEAGGWTAEIAIPRRFLEGFPASLADAKGVCRLALRRAGSGEEQPMILAVGDDDRRLWPYVVFQR